MDLYYILIDGEILNILNDGETESSPMIFDDEKFAIKTFEGFIKTLKEKGENKKLELKKAKVVENPYAYK